MEKINIDVLKNVLTPKEMRNVIGGSDENGNCCCWVCSNGNAGCASSYDQCWNLAEKYCPVPESITLKSEC